MSEASVKKIKLLVADDDPSVQSLLKSRFERRGYEVHLASDGLEAVELYQKEKVDVLLCDIRMPKEDGYYVLEKVSVPTILITGHGDKEAAIKAVDLGAFAFFEKPFDLEALEISLKRALEKQSLIKEREALIARLDEMLKLQNRELISLTQKGESHFIGQCPEILEIKKILQKLAKKSTANLLILGETGTGKEVACRELHRLTHGENEHVPFLALNCAAIPGELLESELFGHEKGSFTGAHQNRIGLCEAVRHGTLFLDEIGEMDIKLQAKLLRLLEARSFRRVGSNHELQFKGRIVAATHRDLLARSKDGLFREDLYYRLSVVSVTLPPLRERGRDLSLIGEALCKNFGLQGIAPQSLSAFLSYEWPGNIREMKNWIERCVLLDDYDSEKRLYKVPLSIKNTTPTETQNSESFDTNLSIKEKRQRVLDEADRQWIIAALDKHHWNISESAKELGLDRKNLSRRMKDLGIQDPRKRVA